MLDNIEKFGLGSRDKANYYYLYRSALISNTLIDGVLWYMYAMYYVLHSYVGYNAEIVNIIN